MSSAEDQDVDPQRSGDHRGLFALAVVAVVLLGVVLGVVTGLQATRVVTLGPARVSLGAVAAFAATAGFGAFAGWGLHGREAAVLPGLGWLIGLLGLIVLPRPGGDILVPGSGADVFAFLGGGLVGVPIAVVAAARLLAREARLGPLKAAHPSPPDQDGR